MRQKLKIAVLMGGKSPEHEISLISGREVVKNLPKKYTPLPVVISRDGKRWRLTNKKALLSSKDPLELVGSKKEIVLSKSQLTDINEQSQKADVCFIAMHGPYGEDGTIQGMLELAGVLYTGPGVLASALGMDKIMFKKTMSHHGIPTPKFIAVKKGEASSNIHKVLGPLPYVVKPHNQGSSVGISIVKRKKDLKKAFNMSYRFSDLAVVEEYIKGIEVTCGILGNDDPIAFPLVEIIPLKGEFFNYESKYTESGAEEIVPARISKLLTKKVQNMAIDVYKALGCKGFSRVDFILRNGKDPVVLEINTIPGLTPMSLLPKAAKANGITYGQLLDKIIKYAIK